MTTVTIVTGDNHSGRRLVGMALASFIRVSQGKSTYALTSTSKLKPVNFADKLDDLILVSSSNQIENWMKPWIEQYGAPLFTIHITRHHHEPSNPPK